MSQSKMSIIDYSTKKFVIKHIFKNVTKSTGGEYEGDSEKHFGVFWRIRIKTGSFLYIHLDCLGPDGTNEVWEIETYINGTVTKKESKSFVKNETFVYSNSFPSCPDLLPSDNADASSLLLNGSLTVELKVKITKMSRIEIPNLRSFDDDSAKEDSDVTLIVKDQKFHVLKKYLSIHSSFFKALFSGNFSEFQKSEIELKDIDPIDFQMFLELIYGESSVEDFSVFKILHLADFFDSKSAIRRCELFLLEKSKLPVKDKHHAATKYNLEKLKNKCISEIKDNFLSSNVLGYPSPFGASAW